MPLSIDFITLTTAIGNGQNANNSTTTNIDNGSESSTSSSRPIHQSVGQGQAMNSGGGSDTRYAQLLHCRLFDDAADALVDRVGYNSSVSTRLTTSAENVSSLEQVVRSSVSSNALGFSDTALITKNAQSCVQSVVHTELLIDSNLRQIQV